MMLKWFSPSGQRTGFTSAENCPIGHLIYFRSEGSSLMTFPFVSRRLTFPRFFVAAFLLLAPFAPFVIANFSYAADAAAPTPDVIILSNGDQLTGKVLQAAGDTVAFHSDIVGDVKVPWAKIKELRSPQKFAVIEKGVKPGRRAAGADIPQGTIAITDQNIQVHTDGGGTTPPVPLKTVDFLIDQPTYQKEVAGHPGFLHGWNGGVTAGSTIVAATQKTYTVSGGLALVRAIPDVPWLTPRNRTTIDFTGSYGKITDPSYTIPATSTTPATFVPSNSIKTAIYHADAERDEYLSDRFYVLGATAFDHNFSQSLDLQQIYGGGVGWTIIKQPKQTLDLKATIQYEKQQFINALPGENQNLIGSTFAAIYVRKLPKGILFSQQLAYIPAWNNLHAYSVNEIDGLALPVYKRLSLSLGTIDSYLNNPASTLPPTKRNSFQFTAGVTYNLR